MKKLILAATTLLATTTSATAITISAGIGGWNQNPSGWIEYRENGLITTETHVDVESDLHISDKTKASGWFLIEGIPILPDIRVQYTPMKFSGRGIVSKEFSFGNITVRANDLVESELEANQIDVTLYYGVPFLGTLTAGKLNLNAGINVKVIDGYAKVRDLTRGIEESKSATIPVPMLHLAGSIKPIDSISFEFSGNWIGYSGSQFYETVGELKVFPAKHLFIGTGYRYQRLKIDDISDVSSDLKIKGFFAEAGFLF
ncbi:TIGR04219 family outer membrane beta-barrel protein [Phorcysia thermohydrogeniphila]|uniref:Outer membrane protein n=1 Tax=Phorcysia thermohydrogeniphila TaxID=936138 RepID=A0A4R1GI49_9BACT|nr:TIGR04219 family outer membrane beta-barrel protein [Phorcysia thermohydrogeniphila]TCK06535.1 outer membrane protein [Phorcysia thermohydrogeniphila]